MNSRRKFLKIMFSAGAVLGFASSAKAKSVTEKGEKVKMLTPDGKMVEVEKSKITSGNSLRASNNEVLRWMETRNKTS